MPCTPLTPRTSTLIGTLMLIGTSIGSSLLGQTSCTSVTFDGYTYNAVKIGNQCWFSNNLRTTVYADGTSIPEITGTSEWSNTSASSVGARCNHENNAGNVNVHGRLYNWFAVTDASGICPTGWDVPSSSDWEELEIHLGANGYSGNEGTALKAAIGWDDGTGTNAVGFNGRASGHRNLHGHFGSFGEKGRFWSRTDVAHNEDRAWSYTIQEYQSHINADEGCFYTAGVSVRCMRDAVTGCTDSGACNYTAAANSDDGSCTYATNWYADADGDGLGDANDSQSACSQPSGYVSNSNDNCDDTSACNYDDSANGSCTYTTAVAQNTSVQLDVNGSASVVAASLDNGSTGCGGIASYSLSQSTFGCGDIGTNNVTFTVTDGDGNTASTTITVTVTQTDTDGDGILDCDDLCSDNTAINYNLLPQEDCAFDCDGLDAPLVFTGLTLSSKASSTDVSDGEVNLTFSGGYGTKAAHFSGATPHTTGTHNFSLAASLGAVPQGHWSVYVTDEAGCEGRCDGCGNTNRVTLQVVVPHERCD